jgi:hypothetical protein
LIDDIIKTYPIFIGYASEIYLINIGLKSTLFLASAGTGICVFMKDFKDIILISKIARETPYSAEYLSLLTRTGKISGRKVGRNWYISKKSLAKYLEKRGAESQINFIVQQSSFKPVLAADSISPIGPIGPITPVELEPKGQTLEPEFPRSGLENAKPSATQEIAPKTNLVPEIRKELDELERLYNTNIRSTDSGQARIKANDADENVIPACPPSGVAEEPESRSWIPHQVRDDNNLEAKLPSGTTSKIRPWKIVAVAFLALAFILGGFNLKFASALYDKLADFVGNATTLQGHVPGTHANEVLLINKAGDISIYGHIETKGQLRSTIENGVAPIVVDSMTTVENLSADYLDNISAEEFTLSLVTKNGNVTYDNVKLEGGAEIGKLLLVKGAANFLDYVSIAKDLTVNGRATIANGIEAIGNSSFLGYVTVKGSVDISNLIAAQRGQIKEGGLTVSGATQLNSLGVTGGASVSDLGVAGNFSAAGKQIDIGDSTSDKLTVTASTTFSGAFLVSDSAYFNKQVSIRSGGISVTGNSGVTGDLSVSGAGTFGSFSTDMLGVGSTTPGAALGVAGAGLFEGFVSADYFTSTSTNNSWLFGNFGLGTTTPGSRFSVAGAITSDGFISADYFTSTSSNVSWLMGSMGFGTTTPGARIGVKGSIISDGFVSANYFTSTSSLASWFLGSFGIGTTTPGTRFAVEGDTDIKGNLYAEGTTTTSSLIATSTLEVRGETGYDFVVEKGRTGIATDTPSTTLSVAGSGLFGTNLTVEGTSDFQGPANFGSTITFADTATTTFAGAVQAAGLASSMGITLTGGDIISSGRLKVNSSSNSYLMGNTGIGTTNPQSKLHASIGTIGAGSNVEALRIGGTFTDTGSSQSISFYAGSDATKFAEIQQGLDASGNGGQLRFLTRSTAGVNTERMRIGEGGNIGIATTTPGNTLDVNGSANFDSLYVQATSTVSSLIATSTLEVRGVTGKDLWVGNGRVGIATDTPSHSLSVANPILVGGTGTSTIEDSLYVKNYLKVGSSSTYIASNYLQFSGASSIDVSDTSLNIDSGTLFVDGAGNNVGIGTISPSSTLTISNDTSNSVGDLFQAINSTGGYNMVILNNGSVGIGMTNPSGYLHTYGNTYLATAEGSVGIGVTNPTAQLQINTFAGTDAFKVGSSTTQFIVDSKGQVGIGLSNPTYPLQVRKDQNAGTFVGVQNATVGTSAYSGFYAINDGGVGIIQRAMSSGFTTSGLDIANSGQIYADGNLSGGLVIEHGGAYPIILGTTATERMRIDAGGNVGIGTTTPGNLLDVNGAVGFDSMYVQSTSTMSSLIATSTLEVRGQSGKDFVVWNGRVGIATDTPGTLLSVHGDANIQNNLTVEGTLIAKAGSAASPSMVFADDTNTGFFWNATPGIGFSVNGVQVGYWHSAGLTMNTKIEMNGQVLALANGTVGAPSLIFSSDTDNGMWSSGADTINFSTNATERLRIDAGGNVGIARSNPSTALQVVGDITAGFASLGTGLGDINILGSDINLGNDGKATSTLTSIGGKLSIYDNSQSSTTPGAILSIHSASTTAGALLVNQTLAGPIFTVQDNGATVFDVRDGGNVIVNTGSVGIGLTNPSAQLHLNTVAGSNAFSIGSTTTQFIVNDKGRVGIGTSAPVSVLSIQKTGDINEKADISFKTTLNTTQPTVQYTVGRIYGTFDGDAYTTGRLTFATVNGAEDTYTDVMSIKNGNVGIGTTAPGQKLTVYGATGTYAGLQIDTNTLGYSTGMLFKTTADTGANYWKGGLFYVSTGDGNGRGDIYLGANIANTSASVSPATLTGIAINGTTGNVGIGTTAPAWLTQISGTRPSIALSDSSAGTDLKHWIMSSMDGEFYIGTTTDAYATSTPPVISMMGVTGNVGIGIANPVAKLHVSGKGINNLLNLENTGTAGWIAFKELGTIRGYLGYSDAGGLLGNATTDSISLISNASLHLSGGGTGTADLTIDSGGNVGIGTTAPAGKLEVAGTVTAAANAHNKGISYTGTLVEPTTNYYSAGVNSVPVFGNGSGTMADAMGIYTGGYTKGASTIVTNSYGLFVDTNTMTTTNSYGIYVIVPSGGATKNVAAYFGGNVGIGTTAPLAKLQVNGSVSLGTYATAGTKFFGTTGLSGEWGGNDGSAGMGIVANGGAYSQELAFHTYSYGLEGGERMRIDKTGNVGIGLTAPVAKTQINVASQVTLGSSLGLWISDASGGTGVVHQIGFGYGTGTTKPGAVIGGINEENSGYTQEGLFFATRGVTTDTAPTERMRITKDGNVGIGTTTPDGILSISGGTAQNQLLTLNAFAGGTGPIITGRMALGTPTAPTAVTADYSLISIQGAGYDGADFTNRRAAIHLNSAEDWTSVAQGTYMYFRVTPIGSTTIAEVMRITASGNVGIGTTAPTAQLQLSTVAGSNAFLVGSSTTQFVIDSKGSVGIGGASGARLSVTGTFDKVSNNAMIIDPSFYPNAASNDYGLSIYPGAYLDNAGSTRSLYVRPASVVAGKTLGEGTGIYIANAAGAGTITTQYGIYIENMVAGGTDYSIYAAGGNAYFGNDVSALSYTDRTAYPKDLNQAYESVMSMQRLPDGLYDENNREMQLDHTYLNSFIKASNGERDMSASISAINEVTKFILNTIGGTSTPLTVDSNTNFVGIGTTTPNYLLTVGGDIAATAFVNVSTQSAKKDIEYLTGEEESSILDKIKDTPVATYNYTNDQSPIINDQSIINGKRMGLIAENAPAEVLSIDGKGVDIYKLSTFTLAGLKALQIKVEDIATRVASLEVSGFGSSIEAKPLYGGLASIVAVSKDFLASIASTIGDWANGALAQTSKLFVASEDETNKSYKTYNLEGSREEIQISGTATLVMLPADPLTGLAPAGAKIKFDESFSSVISETELIKVIVTPTTRLNGSLYVHQKSRFGFEIREINAQDEGGMFDWIVIARKRGSEEPTDANTPIDANDANLTPSTDSTSSPQAPSETPSTPSETVIPPAEVTPPTEEVVPPPVEEMVPPTEEPVVPPVEEPAPVVEEPVVPPVEEPIITP